MEYELLDELEDILTCPICYGPAVDPQQEQNCGRLFCSECIEQLEDDCCPHCRNDANYFQDTKSGREVSALRVMCNNEGRGCDWEGTIGTLQDHLSECGFTSLLCPNGCSHILKKDLPTHLNFHCPERQYKCKDCGLNDKFRVVTGPHENECENKMIHCVNKGCDSVMERKFLQEHMRLSCDYSIISCKHANIGCTESRIRMEMADHEEDMKHHFSLALNKIAELTRRMETQEMKHLGKDGRPQVTIKMSEYSYKKRNNHIYYSEPFFTSHSGYKMCLMVYANGDNKQGSQLSVFLRVLRGPHDDKLAWPLKYTFTLELLNQLEDEHHFVRSLTFPDDEIISRPDCSGWGYPNFIELIKLDLEKTTNTQYLKDNTLFFRITSPAATVHKPWLDYTHN